MAGDFSSSGWGMTVTGIDQTRRMLDDIKMDFDGSTVYIVGPKTHYAVYHELGTSKMAARPFMRPAAQRVKANMMTYAREVSSAQSIPLNSEENIVRCVALAVEAEAKDIARAKDVHDTGQTIQSIEARQK